jgi:glutaredoxin
VTYYIITREDCSWCDKAIDLLEQQGEAVVAFLYTDHPMFTKFMVAAKMKTVPQIWHENEYIGGYAELYKYLEELKE